MKLTLLLITLFSLSFSTTQNQPDKVNKATYKVTVNTDFDINQKALLKKIKNSTVEAELYFNSYSSIFKRVRAMKTSGGLDNEVLMARGIAGRGIRYININSKEHIYQVKSFFIEAKKRTKVNVIHPLIKYNWTITKESKIISGYLCYKALTTIEEQGIKGKIKNHITAWFTPEISTPSGPKGINGLPGLIVFINISDKYFFSLDKLELNIKNFRIEKPEKAREILKKTYDSILRERMPFLKKFKE